MEYKLTSPLASFPGLPTIQFLIPANNTASDQKLNRWKDLEMKLILN